MVNPVQEPRRPLRTVYGWFCDIWCGIKTMCRNPVFWFAVMWVAFWWTLIFTRDK